MDLTGQIVRIAVSEPWDWTEENLLNLALECDDYKLLVKLTRELKGNKLIGDLMELKPRYEKDAFSLLSRHRSVTANGTLVSTDRNDFELGALL